jgi:hypothetical protein
MKSENNKNKKNIESSVNKTNERLKVKNEINGSQNNESIKVKNENIKNKNTNIESIKVKNKNTNIERSVNKINESQKVKNEILKNKSNEIQNMKNNNIEIEKCKNYLILLFKSFKKENVDLKTFCLCYRQNWRLKMILGKKIKWRFLANFDGYLTQNKFIEECLSNKQNVIKTINLDKNRFIPSKEWKVIKETQLCPPGIEIKIDIENGTKFGRLYKT